MPDRRCTPRPAVTSLCRTPPKVLAERAARNLSAIPDRRVHGDRKACPFCGRTGLTVVDCEGGGWSVQCGWCFAGGPIKHTQRGAKEAWERRARREAKRG